MELLCLRDQSRERTELLLLVINWVWSLVIVVGANGHRVSRLELIGVNRVPIKEQVRDWAAVFTQIVDEGVKLRNRQAIVAQFQGEDGLGGRKAEESGSERILVQPILQEVDCSYVS